MKKLSKAFMAILILLAFYCTVHSSISENYTRTYNLMDRPNGTRQYKLNVVVTQSLYKYYVERSHKQVSEEDFPKFVTPQALKPVAEKLWEIYQGDYEDFANGVLMITHQIPYEVTATAKYPIETIVENKGDCDLLSYVAASIMKAGGLNVVLLYYKNKAHMNVGVNLPTPPRHARTIYCVDYNGIRYYIAECTGGDWRAGWKVGECPQDLIVENPIVVTLEKCEQWSPGQISASYATLKYSNLSLSVSSTFTMQGNTITLSGQLTPKLPDAKITIYIKMGSSPWTIENITSTNFDGQFACTLSLNHAGACYIRASWSGNDNYAGSDSPIVTVTVLPIYFIALLIIVIAIVCIGIIISLISSQKVKEIGSQKLQEIPGLQKKLLPSNTSY